MKKKNQPKKKTRPSGQNTLETLNCLVEFLSPAMPESQQLQIVKTSRDLHELRQKIVALCPMENWIANGPPSQVSVRKPDTVAQVEFPSLAAIATNVWRARKRMLHSESDEPKEEMKHAYRHVVAALDGLTEIGVEIRDMRGQPFDSGMALKVVSFEPTAGISREMITEMIKPTICWKGHLIQMGEVIVGTPQM